jgi:hypothetical protein
MANDKKDKRQVSAYAFAQAIIRCMVVGQTIHIRNNDYGKRIMRAVYVLNDKLDEERIYKSRVERDGQYIKIKRLL